MTLMSASPKILVPRPSWLESVLYNALVCLYCFERYPYLSRLWRRAWQRSCRRFSAPVRTSIHGRNVVVNYGHTYPLYSRRFRTLNNPIVELLFQSYAVKKRSITLVDVGANVGDTILLLESACPGMLGGFCCLDADPEFFAYLQNNLAHLDSGKFVLALLSSHEGSERSLVRHLRSTASPQGHEEVSARTLDSAIREAGVQKIDILKTDVDGFDGRVLQGAREILAKDQPAVIFEWHPLLCRGASSNWTDHFQALEQSGYEKFLWFTKYGEFSHFSGDGERKGVAMLAELCLNSQTYDDWHYDVIALHSRSPLAPLALAEMAYAKKRKSIH